MLPYFVNQYYSYGGLNKMYLLSVNQSWIRTHRHSRKLQNTCLESQLYTNSHDILPSTEDSAGVR